MYELIPEQQIPFAAQPFGNVEHPLLHNIGLGGAAVLSLYRLAA